MRSGTRSRRWINGDAGHRRRVSEGWVMRVVSVMFALLWFAIAGTAQTPAKPGPAGTSKVESNLGQVMRGILFPNSNIIFDAQDTDPAAKPAAADKRASNPYGGWVEVENAALAIAESANLLIIPGRLCMNGKPVPVDRADWIKFVQMLRDAGQAAYKAAQSKNMDDIVDASGVLTDACAACHDVYRDQPNQADRCTP